MNNQGKHDMVLIATCDHLVEAQIYRTLLEEHDIPCFLQGEQHRSMLGEVFGAYIEIGLMVPSSMEERAIALLQEASAPDDLEAQAMAHEPS
jgi:hypothetical protein